MIDAAPGLNCRERALASLDQLPPFSAVLQQLMATLAEDDISVSRLSGVVERDPVLSASVLRLVNSALYGRRGTISSVRHAVSVIGILKLRNYLLGLSISGLWAKARIPGGWSMARFEQHSVAAAVFADLLALHSEVEYPEGAFAGGLLHDLGRLMIAMALPEELQTLNAYYEETAHTLPDCEVHVLGVDHADLSAEALARWNLPPALQAAVLHQVDRRPEWRQTLGHPTLAALIGAANECVNYLGFSIHPLETERAAPPQQALADLELTKEIPALIEQFQAEFEAMRASYR